MKADLDQWMAEAELDALWVTGSAGGNPALDYFVDHAHLEGVHLFKPRGERPVLLHRNLEREEAAATGLRTVELAQERFRQLLEQAEGDQFQAKALQLAEQIDDLGISGRVAVYGQVEAGWLLEMINRLRGLLPDIEWLPDAGSRGVIGQARLTKDAEEVERIRSVGRTTVEVVERIRDYLANHRIEGGILVNADGEVLTIGQVKARTHTLLAERGAQSAAGPIFAQGREATVGHSVGRAEAPIQASTSTIFDIYPCELGGGYYYDFTRTWCPGPVPPAVQDVFDDVKRVYDSVSQMLEVGISTQELQIETCRQFEALGHPTLRTEADTDSGYTHSLGHGIGLQIHEPPSFRHYAMPENSTLRPGMVFSFEPGLYYPERQIAVRLEDTFYVNPDGQIECMVEYPFDLALPLVAD